MKVIDISSDVLPRFCSMLTLISNLSGVGSPSHTSTYMYLHTFLRQLASLYKSCTIDPARNFMWEDVLPIPSLLIELAERTAQEYLLYNLLVLYLLRDVLGSLLQVRNIVNKPEKCCNYPIRFLCSLSVFSI